MARPGVHEQVMLGAEHALQRSEGGVVHLDEIGVVEVDRRPIDRPQHRIGDVGRPGIGKELAAAEDLRRSGAHVLDMLLLLFRSMCDADRAPDVSSRPGYLSRARPDNRMLTRRLFDAPATATGKPRCRTARRPIGWPTGVWHLTGRPAGPPEAQLILLHSGRIGAAGPSRSRRRAPPALASARRADPAAAARRQTSS